MAFCARAMPSARAFLRRFYDLIASIKNKKSFYLVRISLENKYDALVWLKFLNHFNGECYLHERFWLGSETIELFTDSAGNPELGCGAYFAGQWIQCRWPGDWAGTDLMKDVTFLELVPIILALYTWASQFKKKCL